MTFMQFVPRVVSYRPSLSLPRWVARIYSVGVYGLETGLAPHAHGRDERGERGDTIEHSARLRPRSWHSTCSGVRTASTHRPTGKCKLQTSIRRVRLFHSNLLLSFAHTTLPIGTFCSSRRPVSPGPRVAEIQPTSLRYGVGWRGRQSACTSARSV